jgi:hypothetical protein
MDRAVTVANAPEPEQFLLQSEMGHRSVLLHELGNGSRLPAGDICDGVCDRYRFSARALIGTDRKNAFDRGRRNAFSYAA